MLALPLAGYDVPSYVITYAYVPDPEVWTF